MPRRVAQSLIVATLVLSIGAHWGMLQTLAWVSMAVSYSHSVPLRVALQKTFDGQHPCHLCKAVAAGKKSEQNRTALKLETKFDLFCLSEQVVPQFVSTLFLPFAESNSAPSRVETPPRPPPRRA
jgi:hypothetical protein